MAPGDPALDGPTVASRTPGPSPEAGAARPSGPLAKVCFVCQGPRLHYAFSQDGYRLVRCADCRLMFVNPQPSEGALAELGDDPPSPIDPEPEAPEQLARTRQATARLRLHDLARYRGRSGGRLLEVGCGRGELLVEAARAGFEVTGIEGSTEAAAEARARLAGAGTVRDGDLSAVAGLRFDVILLSGVLDQARDPVAYLSSVRDRLAPGSTLLLTTPSLDSWVARLLRRSWFEFGARHLFYFDRATIQHVLYRAGFENVLVRPARKVVSLGRIARRLERFPVPVLSRLVTTAARMSPSAVRWQPLTAGSGEMLVFAEPRTAAPVPRVSVVVPAFNEAATLAPLLDSVLQRDFRPAEIELILVESGSTDGTREIAERYAAHPRVRLVQEDRPRGKGHAVRTGLRVATGDFVLIQDADLEYDVEDYDSLLEPLLRTREAFVLGSRHGGGAWKMRRFAGQPALSLSLNFGHWFFATLVNVLFAQRLRDPFTMYKVFRRDCLFGVRLECNRFDFDFELLIKLLRKGYRPLEIPVNYRSRSFHEGKKVSMWSDPWSWLRILAKLRLSRFDPLTVVEEERPSRRPR